MTILLNKHPKPLHSEDYVKIHECKDDWANAPPSMLIQSAAQMACLGKVYDWRFIQKETRSLSYLILKTNDSVFYPLKSRGLLTFDYNKWVKITQMGVRVYELNYYLRQISARQTQDKIYTNMMERMAGMRAMRTTS